MMSVLTQKGYLLSVETEDPLKIRTLEKYNLFILLSPLGKKYQPYEVNALISYVREGGSLLVLCRAGGDTKNKTNLNSILNHFGIQTTDSVLFDPRNNFYEDPNVIKGMKAETVPNDSGEEEYPFSNTVSFIASPQRILLTSTSTTMGGIQAIAVRSGDNMSGKLIAIGTHEILNDSSVGMKYKPNMELFIRYVRWLVNQEDPVETDVHKIKPPIEAGNDPKIGVVQLEENDDFMDDSSEEEILDKTSQKLINEFLDEVDVSEISHDLDMNNFDVQDVTTRILRAFLSNALHEARNLELQKSFQNIQIEGFDQILMVLYNIGKTLEEIKDSINKESE